MARAIWRGAVLAESDDVVVDEAVNAMAAWTYLDPSPAANRIKGRVAFWRGVEVGS